MSPSKIISPEKNASVTGLITTLSPVKPNNYFDGELTDGDSVIRLVGFEKNKLSQLTPFADYRLPVTLKGCVIQKNKYKDEYEVVLKTNTKIVESKKFLMSLTPALLAAEWLNSPS